MKISSTSTSNKRPVIIGLALLSAVAILASLFFILRQNDMPSTPTKDVNQIDYGPASQDQKVSGEQAKLDAVNDTGDTPATTDLKAAITEATRDQQDDQFVFKTSLTASSKWSSCTLTLRQGTRTISKQADTLYQPDFSTCLGFSVPLGEFPSTGTWQATLVATTSDQQTVTSPTRDFTVTK